VRLGLGSSTNTSPSQSGSRVCMCSTLILAHRAVRLFYSSEPPHMPVIGTVGVAPQMSHFLVQSGFKPEDFRCCFRGFRCFEVSVKDSIGSERIESSVVMNRPAVGGWQIIARCVNNYIPAMGSIEPVAFVVLPPFYFLSSFCIAVCLAHTGYSGWLLSFSLMWRII
jgi:hypothetical protein